jgi:hypothetical protein
MTAETVLQLIQLATQLAQIIEQEVKASNDAEVQAAWEAAKADFEEALKQTQ